jgi:hypothetical protein
LSAAVLLADAPVAGAFAGVATGLAGASALGAGLAVSVGLDPAAAAVAFSMDGFSAAVAGVFASVVLVLEVGCFAMILFPMSSGRNRLFIPSVLTSTWSFVCFRKRRADTVVGCFDGG